MILTDRGVDDKERVFVLYKEVTGEVAVAV